MPSRDELVYVSRSGRRVAIRGRSVRCACYEEVRIDSTKSVVDNPPMRPARRKPTDAELGILSVLWSRGPSTVRQIAEAMGREAAYTTILKLLQIMTEKRLVIRDEGARTHVYAAAYTQDDTQRQLVADLLERAFDGSAAKLVLQALASGKTSAEDLTEIKKLLRGASAPPAGDHKPGGTR
jgi:predicted transcriptional regulator